MPDLQTRLSEGYALSRNYCETFYTIILGLKQILADAMSSVVTGISQFLDSHPFLKYSSLIIVILGCITAAFKIVASLSYKEEVRPESEAYNMRKGVRTFKTSTIPHVGVKTEAYVNRKARTQIKRDVRTVHAATNYVAPTSSEGGADRVCDQLIDKITSRNVYEVHTPSSVNRIGFATFIVGRLFILPKHFVKSIDMSNKMGYYPENPVITLRSLSSKLEHIIPLEVILNGKTCTSTGGQDIVMCEAPRNVQPHVDISNYFVSKKYATLDRDYFTKLVVCREGGLVEYCSYANVFDSIEVISPDETFIIRAGYQCDAPTSVGDCGSLLYLVDSSNAVGKILGSHSAGDNSRRAFSTSIFFEDIASGITMFQKQVSSQMEEDRFDQLHNLPVEGAFTPLFVHDLEVRQPKANKVVPSLLFSQWGESEYAPSALTRRLQNDGSYLYPMDVALNVYSANSLFLDDVKLNACSEHYLAYIINNSDYKSMHKPIVYDFDVAVCGNPGVDYCESLSRSTSAGFPWCVTVGRTHKGKTFFFGNEGDFDLQSEGALIIREEVNGIIEDAKKGIRRLHIYTDNLKDEKRKISKVELAKTRLFSGCPLGLQIATRMYFLDFSMSIMRNRIRNGIAVGINVYSSEWHELAMKLSSKGDAVIAGDFSGYDGSLQPQVLNVILDLINSWYDDGAENALVRSVLWCEVFNSRHINGNKVYEWCHSLPSGHVLTVIINSIYDHIAFRFAWIQAHGGNPLSLANYNDNVFCIAFGDDNVLNISKSSLDVFNQETMPTLLQPLGLIYTNESKDDSRTISRKITEVTFLKRAWIFDPPLDRYVAPLVMASILEMPYWSKEGPMNLTITKTNVDKALEELALHPISVFNEWYPRISRASKEVLGYQPQFSNYEMLKLKCLSSLDYY